MLNPINKITMIQSTKQMIDTFGQPYTQTFSGTWFDYLQKNNPELYEKVKHKDLRRFDIGSFTNIAMPLVAKVFPDLASKDLVGVRPMFTPTGLSYALRYRFFSSSFRNTWFDFLEKENIIVDRKRTDYTDIGSFTPSFDSLVKDV